MGTKVKDTGSGDFKLVPQGTHQAVCNLVVDLGEQSTTYQDVVTMKHQVYLRWEIPGERVEYEIDGNAKEGPMTIGKTYTASLHEKANLRKDLTGWRDQSFTQEELGGFDIESVLGKCCQLVVTHDELKDKTYAKIATVAGWPKGLEKIKAENEPVYYGPEDTAKFNLLPNWIQKKLNGGEQAELTDVDYDDDIPF